MLGDSVQRHMVATHFQLQLRTCVFENYLDHAVIAYQ